jgi:hypothetical protein
MCVFIDLGRESDPLPLSGFRRQRPDRPIETPVAFAINLIAGAVLPAELRTHPHVQLEDDASCLDRLPELFEMPPPLPESDSERSAASGGVGD